MQNKTAILGIAAVAIIGIAVFGLTAMRPNTNSQNNDPSMVSPTGMVVEATLDPSGMEGTPTADVVEGEYTDGTYTAEGMYTSPAGPENVNVTVTLADGVIEDVEFEGLTENETSMRYQGLFAEGYKAMVVGKSIDEVQLDKVSGSSLTPKGFNDAISKIKAEAQG